MSGHAGLVSVFADEARQRAFRQADDSGDRLDWNRTERARLPKLIAPAP